MGEDGSNIRNPRIPRTPQRTGLGTMFGSRSMA